MRDLSDVNYDITKYKKLMDDLGIVRYNLVRSADNIKTMISLLDDAYEINKTSPYYKRLKRLLEKINVMSDYLGNTVIKNARNKYDDLAEEQIKVKEGNDKND